MPACVRVCVCACLALVVVVGVVVGAWKRTLGTGAEAVTSPPSRFCLSLNNNNNNNCCTQTKQTNKQTQISRIVDSMPRIMHASRARKLGLPQDSTIEEIIEGCVLACVTIERECVCVCFTRWGLGWGLVGCVGGVRGARVADWLIG